METHLDSLARDFRYALRSLGKDSRFSLIAIIALALGVGASTVVFSVVYNVFFHSLPYKNFDRSVVVVLHDLTDGNNSKDRRYFNAEEVGGFREQNDVFEDVIGYARMRPTYDDGKSVRYFHLER